MKVSTSSVLDMLSRMRVYFQSDSTPKNIGDDMPFNSELYSSNQMDRHAKVVARSHKLLQRNSADQLLKRLDDNEKTLLEVRDLLIENIRIGKVITPGAEWLLDNFYLIAEQIVIARKHLPKGYSEALPCLSGGISAGMPRVYDIVLEIISHSDGRVDARGLSSFVAAYQTHTVLTLGELWAIPIMLRLAVIENLRRVSWKIALDMVDHNLADYWADKMMATISEEPANLIIVLADLAKSRPVLTSPFVAGFTRKLQGTGLALALPLNWMEQQLTATGISSDELVRLENQKQATDQVSVRNNISTLRFLASIDWREFVETLSSVEQVLMQDPGGTYPRMDFATRDRYRHVVEAIAKSSHLTETEVAVKVLELSQHGSGKKGHVGYYLVDKGLPQTEKVTGRFFSARQNIRRFLAGMPVFLYCFSVVLLSIAAASGMLYLAYTNGISNRFVLTALAVLSLSGAAQLAISLVNWLATLWVMPSLLPRMDFSRGIPAECRTLVIVPTMLSGEAYIEELVEGLEIRFLANREKNVHFGLLTDFLDADSEVLPGDNALVESVRQKIEALNEKYKQPDEDIFFLFHRPRVWNEGEGKWMGYERKRGKLAALGATLRGRNGNHFSVISGNYGILSAVKYVITLDSDTQLPREAVWKFVATMAHPLNHPVYDKNKKRVTEGYGILQPRVATGIPKTFTTPYLRMQGNTSGIDPYTRVSSDVYQDVFGEGSFIGKGIYDVDIFELGLHDVFQENRILSHDLLEGCYIRSGLLSDVLLYEENPSDYAADIKRRHRWIRGDWQIGAWMLPFITGHNKKLTANKLSALSRWKIFDNLRRSLLPLSIFSLLILGWFVLPFSWFWTSAVTIIILLPLFAATGWQLLNKPKDITFRAHLEEITGSVQAIVIQFIFGIAVLPYEAMKYTDAVLKTNWRLLVTKKKLLEWAPFSNTNKSSARSLAASFQSMWIAPLASIACTAFLLFTNNETLAVASPILFLWLVAPALTWLAGRHDPEESLDLPEEQTAFLHKTARKTWSFFEEFVNENENWLPPDNYQEQPVAVIAHRTSPTNMGLALLANLAAYDFGYVTSAELLDRCDNTLESMFKLERHRGHFYNWYDTLSMLPLPPRYVSTVDSGNLVGHLLTLRQGILSLPSQRIFDTRLFSGLQTTADVLFDLSGGAVRNISKKILERIDLGKKEAFTIPALNKHLEVLYSLANELEACENELVSVSFKWKSRLVQQIKRLHSDMYEFFPWLTVTETPERFLAVVLPEAIPSFNELKDMKDALKLPLPSPEGTGSYEENEWIRHMQEAFSKAAAKAVDSIALAERLAAECEILSDVDYSFLIDKPTNLLRIGFNVEEQRKDDSFYDLLASEARLGIFVAIAQGKLPQETWFALGRLLTDPGGEPILLSWSGSMFEYLMPQLVMPVYENTLLYQTGKASVKRQIDYAAQRGIPWGISESAYNTVDANFNYQYRAFGVPGLGLKRGLEEDLVIAPYATMLALMVSPARAAENLEVLAGDGFEGEYGFYEAVDYTVSRLPRGENKSIIRSFMVHHQGMGLLSLAYVLLNKPMQQRFAAELRFQATLLLLQERIPRATLFYAHTPETLETTQVSTDVQVRRITRANTAIPEIQLLSNGRYQVMVSNSGGGYSRWKGIAITRWREDATRDNTGIFCYIKDVNSGHFWSNTHQPTLQTAKGYEAVFSLGHVEFQRLDHGIATKTEIVISPEDDTEMRRIRITNKTQSTRILEITSYAEVVLNSQAADVSHPAFSNLFVQTEIIPEHKTIFCTRRPRSGDEIPPWMFHLMSVHGATIESVSYETDRAQFVGRGNSLANPQAMAVDVLSGKQGDVLDPIVSIRYRIILKPNQIASIDLIYGVSETRESCEILMHKYRDQHLKKRAFELSWTHSQVILRQINATEADAQLYDRLAASIIYSNQALRADASVILTNLRGQSGLWSHSVSGDLPVVLLQVSASENMNLIRQMIQAHAYWRLKGLAVDLVIWNEDYGSYRQVLQEQILGLISAESVSTIAYTKPGNIFVKSVDQISSEDRILFESVAHVIIHDSKGTLAEQLNRQVAERVLPPPLEPKQVVAPEQDPELKLPADLLFFNGTGGFTPDGKEYKIRRGRNETTPAPWVNVIANAEFGTVISERGSAYTWAVNAHEYRLTPWSNDPVSDGGGEAFYIRDEESGVFWSPSPFPAGINNSYLTTHGFGYSVYETSSLGIRTEMCVFVDNESPVKFIVLKIKNHSGRERKFSATGFMEIILGDERSKTNMHVISEQDAETEAILLRNRYNTAFSDRVTFFKVDGANLSFTADRTEFIGRNGTLADPRALYRKKLSGRSGAGIDPCAALQIKFDLLDGGEKEIVFKIGSAENTHAVKALIRKFSEEDAAGQSLNRVKEYWKNTLEQTQVVTPDPSLNILANGWLTYQTLACRIFARSGFYQSGGAYGFRDQLQDTLALIHTRPDLVRDHILLSASRQFSEGDVQHWWHPPEGRGVRTRCSDDLLWLPYVVSEYVKATGDTTILHANAGFLESRVLNYEEDSFYDLPGRGAHEDTIYEHCLRAIKYSLRFGSHGLPLIGSGDWNDGMDQVGNKGAGESVWLAFFLYKVMSEFLPIARHFGDADFEGQCITEIATLQKNIENAGWDGQWYLRAYFDDGTPLGSKNNDECRIDAIAQSWSVLSGAGDKQRSLMAMDSVEKYLVKREMGLIQLLDPPFNQHGPNPGYIRGYVPGVRENGGQYSHAAIWVMMAFAALGDRRKVWELFHMVNPVNHALDGAAVARYKVEPYVMAADVYANDSHKAMGGWTWYTGSAGWMYQFITRSLLGMQLQAGNLKFEPCFPEDWPSVFISYRYKTATYLITVYQFKGQGESWWKTGENSGTGNLLVLADDGKEHTTEMHIRISD